jgi:hypothetical protein
LLADASADVILVECVPEPWAVGAAILLQPNAVLYGLGLRDAVHTRTSISPPLPPGWRGCRPRASSTWERRLATIQLDIDGDISY